jgi:hypothetical protein
MAAKPAILLLAAAFAVMAAAASAGELSVDLRGAPANPARPQMGDRLSFRSVLRNEGSAPVSRVMVWISLIRIDPGNEQPVDLEDWSAQKAVTADSLPVGGTIEAAWSLRLIQGGAYRLMVAAYSQDGGRTAFGPATEFTVREKPVVQARRVLPVALGFPLVIATVMLWRWRRS